MSAPTSNEIEMLEWAVELQTLSLEMLQRIATRTLDDTDGSLFALARQAKNASEQRAHLDAMYALRKLRPAFIEDLHSLFADSFASVATQHGEFSEHAVHSPASALQGMYPWEEWIDLASLVTRLEQVHAQRLAELAPRMQTLTQQFLAPIKPESLLPAAFVLPFAQSAVALGIDMEVTRVMFERLERVLTRDLDTLYVCAVEDLDAHGLGPKAEPAVVDAQVEPEPVPEIVYDDHALQADLATLRQNLIPAGWDANQAQACTQRAAAITQWFDELLHDSALAASLKPQLERFGYPLLKIALRDTEFFTQPQHPARALLGELTSLGYVARISGQVMLGRVERMLAQVQLPQQVSAVELGPRGSPLALLDANVIERFHSERQDEARRRRQSMIGKVRRIVAEMLRVQAQGRRIPLGLQMLLSSGWAPMMALRLLKQGAESPSANAGMVLLHNLLDVSDPDQAGRFDAPRCNALQQEISASLRDAGMTPTQVDELVRAWRADLDRIVQKALAEAEAALASAHVGAAGRLGEADFGEELFATAAPQEAHAALPQAPPAPPPIPEAVTQSEVLPDANALLDLLIAPGTWLRVHDDAAAQTRWLRRIAAQVDQRDITLASIGDHEPMHVERSRLLEQMLYGEAESVEVSPLGEYWLDRMRQAR